jgi:3-ketosteroid 9alpha-monooxygenase subunit B
MTDEARAAAVRRHGFHELPVIAIVQETADTRTFVLGPPATDPELFTYRAGQFCTARIHLDGDDVLRCYSMSSAPATDDRLALTVKRVPGGVMSNGLHDHVEVGDVLDLMPPSGTFTLPDRDDADEGGRDVDAPIVAFCGGSGVTPVISLVKQALATTDRTLRVLYANRDDGSVIFRTVLDDLVAAHPDRLSVRYHLDTDGGFLDADEIAAFVGDDTGADIYICGPTAFMDVVEVGLSTAGVPVERISIERFANAPVLDELVIDAPEPIEPGDTVTDDGFDLTIKLKRKKHTVTYVAGDTILDTARRAGLRPPSSCELGNCASCMALCTTGSATMRANNALTPDEVAEGWVLTCQALPDGPAVVEYEDL